MIGKKRQLVSPGEDDRLTEELEETFPASDPPSATEPGEGISGDPTVEERLHKIRQRAYEIWVEEGGAHGGHEDHWRRAESEFGPGGEPSVKRPKS